MTDPTIELLQRKLDALQTVVARIHVIMGESPQSDDASLPDFIEQFVREHQKRDELYWEVVPPQRDLMPKS